MDGLLFVSNAHALQLAALTIIHRRILFSGLAVYRSTHLANASRFQIRMPNVHVYNALLFGVPFALFCVLLVLG